MRFLGIQESIKTLKLNYRTNYSVSRYLTSWLIYNVDVVTPVKLHYVKFYILAYFFVVFCRVKEKVEIFFRIHFFMMMTVDVGSVIMLDQYNLCCHP